MLAWDGQVYGGCHIWTHRSCAHHVFGHRVPMTCYISAGGLGYRMYPMYGHGLYTALRAVSLMRRLPPRRWTPMTWVSDVHPRCTSVGTHGKDTMWPMGPSSCMISAPIDSAAYRRWPTLIEGGLPPMNTTLRCGV